MPKKMVFDTEIAHLSVPDRFFSYAHAYRSAAVALCKQMTEDTELFRWPNASVVLMLAAHATELFLKGAIFFRDPNAGLAHHLINELIEEYTKRYPEPTFKWDVPFKVEYLGCTETEAEMFKKDTPVPSILYRYPVDRGAKTWNTLIGFDPDAFLLILEGMQIDFVRIEGKLT